MPLFVSVKVKSPISKVGGGKKTYDPNPIPGVLQQVPWEIAEGVLAEPLSSMIVMHHDRLWSRSSALCAVHCL